MMSLHASLCGYSILNKPLKYVPRGVVIVIILKFRKYSNNVIKKG